MGNKIDTKYIFRALAVVCIVGVSSGCATTGSSFGSLADEPGAAGADKDAPSKTNGLVPSGDVRYDGVVTKNSNMRSKPSPDGSIVAVVPQGSKIIVSKPEGDWYQVRALVDGKQVNGWIYHTLVSTQLVALDGPSGLVQHAAGEITVTYDGYSEQFIPIHNMLVSDQLDKVEETYAKQEEKYRAKVKSEEKLHDKIGLLRWLERGTLSLDKGAYDTALEQFSISEKLVEKKQSQSTLGGWFDSGMGMAAGTLFGAGEFQPYEAEGWEKVLMLNYKSITYLLQGDRRAYNVTRRAIDWQNIEKKAFDKAVAGTEEELEKENEKAKKKLEAQQKAAADNPDGESNSTPTPTASGIMDVLTRITASGEKKAKSVASAYVNPFGFYVAGMIQEFESYDDRSLRDNARISYSKALELNPNSKVLAAAVEDMKKTSAPRGVNLVHVIVADGFVPEKKTLTYYMNAGNLGVLPMKLPIYEPVGTRVSRIEVQTSSGQRLATLSPVADIEALCLRQQKDLQRVQALEALAAFTVTGLIESSGREAGGWVGIGTMLLGKVRQEASAPDTRSWMSLPATIQAARLRLKKGVSRLNIVSYDKSGKRVASKTVNLNPDSHGVVYVRSLDGAMYPQATEHLWM